MTDDRRHRLSIAACELAFWLAVALLCWRSQMPVFGQEGWQSASQGFWKTFNPPESVDGQGILQQVISRCTEQGRQIAYEPNITTYCHEATHQLNSRIRLSVGGRVNAFFVGCDDGHCAVFREPNVTLATVAQYVPRKFRESTYQLYLLDQQQHWNNEPLYILDEWSAYLNGLQCAYELKIDPTSNISKVNLFCHYADSLVRAVEENDRDYPELSELREFVRWQKERSRNLVDATTNNGGLVAQNCVRCQRPYVIKKPVQKYRIDTQPPTQQTPPAKPPLTADELRKSWQDYIDKGLAEIKQCECDERGYATGDELTLAIDQLRAEVDQKLAILPAPPASYVPPTDEELAARLVPFLPPIELELTRPDGSVQKQTRAIGGPKPLQLRAQSLGIK